MKILALDSSGLVASVAILEDDNLIAEYTVNYKKTHSQTLMGMLDEVVGMTEQDLSSVDAIAVAGGPGSFTGLRIGSASAKGLGMALGKPLISVPTVDAIAYNMYGFDGIVCPMMDARRDQVYTGIYTFTNGESFETILPQTAISIEEICEKINAEGRRAVILGDGVDVYRDKLSQYIKVPHIFAPAHLNKQRAAAVGALGMKYYSEGKIQSAAEHEPEYLRLSQAERERKEKMS